MAEFIHNETKSVDIGEPVDIKIDVSSILISELKKIRAEILKESYCRYVNGVVNVTDVTKILDKKIAELEGK